jgi:integrase
VATTEQVFALRDAVAEHQPPAVLLGAFAGLRTAEVVGLRVIDVDFEDLAICPAQQAGGLELKTAMSKTPVPIPAELADELIASIEKFGGDHVVTDGLQGPSSTWAIERPSEPPSASCRIYRRASGSTIFGTTSRRC